VEEQVKSLEDYLAVLKRRKWQLIVPASLLAIVAIPVALLIPATYRSTATILIEQQAIPADLVRTTVTSFAGQRIQLSSQRVMSTRKLSEIIERHDLYPDLRRKKSINAAVEEMRKAIHREMISADVVDPSGGARRVTTAFALSYESDSPTLAHAVTNDLVSLFLNENIEQRQAAVEETAAFFSTEANRLGKQITTLEAQLAAFKEQHQDSLPEFTGVNRERMGRIEERLRDNSLAVRALEEQKTYLESELAQLSPTLRSVVAAAGASAASPEARLQELETRHVGIAARYSADHPDRIQVEREIAALREQVGQSDTAATQTRLADLTAQLAVLRKRYSEAHPDVATLKRSIAAIEAELAKSKKPTTSTDNPVYVQIRTKLDGTRMEIESLKHARVDLERDLAQIETRVSESPRIEQQYRALTRDYDNAMKAYQEMRGKEMTAELAMSLESERKGERFSLLEPPLVPERPYKPDRRKILSLGLALSVAGGVGHIALREVMEPGLRGARAVLAITGAPPLAVIPYIETQADRRRRTQRRRRWVAGVAIALAGGTAAVHLLWMPLDLLWFKLLHRIEVLMPMLLGPGS